MFYSLERLSYTKKKVLVRADYNVPMEKGEITDDSRIRKTLPTLKYLLSQNPAQIILVSHLGRPEGEFKQEFSLKPVAARLSALLGQPVYLEPTPKAVDIKSLPSQQILMLENIRFDKGEEKNDPAIAKALAGFADVFVFDAFGVSHRDQASVTGVMKLLPTAAGYLMQKEVDFLKTRMQNPEHPFVAIIGGAKEDKIEVIDKLIGKVDSLIVGGVLANTFLKAKGIDIGLSKFSKEHVSYAKDLLKKYESKINLPVDFIVADSYREDAGTRCAGINDDLTKWMIMDIGPYTITGYKGLLSKAKTIVWAGPIGVFEWTPFRRGTWDVASFISTLDCVKIIGGGDSGDAIERFGLADKMTLVSTGGGASLELLSGKDLPGVVGLEENYKKFKKK